MIFKAKTVTTGKWVIGAGLHIPRKNNEDYSTCLLYDISETPSDGPALTLVRAETLCEAIWIADRNNRQAFEHDIAKDMFGGLWVIFHCAGGFGLCTVSEWNDTNGNPESYIGLSGAENSENFHTNYTICGNLHNVNT